MNVAWTLDAVFGGGRRDLHRPDWEKRKKLSRGKKKCFVPRCLAEHGDFLEYNLSVKIFVAVYVYYLILCMRK
jgi:hypothetical protein